MPSDRMRRRRLLKLGSVGILLGGGGVGAIAALGESNPDENTVADSPTTSRAKNGRTPGTGESEQPSTGPQDGLSSNHSQPEAAAFRIAELRAPSTVELGIEYTVDVVVKNTGGAAGTYNSELTVDPGHGTDETVPVELSIPAGETRVYTLTDTIQTMDTASYEIGQHRTEVTGKKRTEPIGTPVTSQGVQITVSSFSEEGRTYQGYEAENGKWIVAEVAAVNTKENSEMQWLPNYFDFQLFDPERTKQYEPSTLGVHFDEYETANVRPGVKRSGPIVFDVPLNTKPNKTIIFYHDDSFDITVEWHPS